MKIKEVTCDKYGTVNFILLYINNNNNKPIEKWERKCQCSLQIGCTFN